jgi:hypothetical protein
MERTSLLVEARLAIEKIMFTYAEGIDLGDIETVAELFANGAIVLPDGTEVRGQSAVFDSYADMVMFYDDDENIVPYQRNACSPRTRHVVTNLIYDFDDAVTLANVRSYFTVYQTLGGTNQVIAGGRYADRFENSGKGWFIATRTIHFDNMGDMSRHNIAFESNG